MKRKEFLSMLESGLSTMPQNEVTKRIEFYNEMIDDQMEEGLSEEEAVARIGSAGEITAQILAEPPLIRLVKEKIKPNRSLKVWEIVLLVLGSPIWLSVLISFFAVAISVYVSIWSVLISLWVVFISLSASAILFVVFGIGYCFNNNILQSIALIGAGFICASISIFLFFGCKFVTYICVLLTKKLGLWFKYRFAKKGGANNENF